LWCGDVKPAADERSLSHATGDFRLLLHVTKIALLLNMIDRHATRDFRGLLHLWPPHTNDFCHMQQKSPVVCDKDRSSAAGLNDVSCSQNSD
jgi:hypothetical protein